MTTTAELDAFLGGTDDKLVVNGRYRIKVGAKVKPHTRITNFAGILEDGFALQGWTQRGTLQGSVYIPPFEIIEAGDDFKKLTALCERAMELNGANVKRDYGTWAHSVCEAADLGQPIDDEARLVVDAYHAALRSHSISVVEVEQVVVLPEFTLAGRFDRIVNHMGTNKILDLKTGTLHPLSIAVQLACYAHAATIYDPATETHRPMPAVDQEIGLVAHLPMGEGRCTIHEVDLTVGWQYAQLAERVRTECRKARLVWPAASLVTPAGDDLLAGFEATA